MPWRVILAPSTPVSLSVKGRGRQVRGLGCRGDVTSAPNVHVFCEECGTRGRVHAEPVPGLAGLR